MRYSRLTRITPVNVSNLKVAWIYHMKPVSPAGGVSRLSSTGFHLSEDQPLVVGATMYVVTPYSRVVALDSVSGGQRWIFQIPDGDQASLRGAAYWPGEGGAEPAII